MSLTRVFQGLFGSRSQEEAKPVVKNVTKPSVSSNLLSRLKLAPFAMLSLLNDVVLASHQSIYVFHPETNTQYNLNYESSEFPAMRAQLINYCNAIISDSSVLNYVHATDAKCLNSNSGATPDLDIDVAVGQQLMRGFQACLNQAMKVMCDDYYNKNVTTSTADNSWIILVCLAGAVALGGCCCYMAVCRDRNQADLALPLDPPAYSELTNSAVIIPVIASSENRYSHHHHHHHNHHDNNDVSVVWGSETNTHSHHADNSSDTSNATSVVWDSEPSSHHHCTP